MNLPNFLIIGAAKAGTTSLYEYLKQHPQIYRCPRKEPHFFSREGETYKHTPKGKFPHDYAITAFADYQALFKDVTNEIAIGEASTSYIYSPKAPKRIKHYIPDVKLIAILRDPVERAYSHFVYWAGKGAEPLTDFALALEAEEKRIRDGINDSWHYKARGFYYLQLKRYFDLFDREQIKVYLYDDFTSDPITVLQDIFRFLGVDDMFFPDISQRVNVSRGLKNMPKNKVLHSFLAQPNYLKSILKPLIPSGWRQNFANQLRHRNLAKFDRPVKPPFEEKLRKQLRAEYREDILKLQDLIDRDLSTWLEPPLG